MKKTGKIVAVILIIWTATCISCNDENLDLQPLYETEACYFLNDDQFFSAIVGTYAKLTDIYYYNNNSPRHYLWLLTGDDLTSRGSYFSESFAGIVTRERGIFDIWRVYYQIINRANTVLEKIDEARDNPDIKITEVTTKFIKGEALFLRSLMYYKLWNLWGTAPLINKRIKDINNIHQPNSQNTELLDQAITDLSLAATILPSVWEEIYTGRATSDAAFGLLGKCLVFRADYYRQTDRSKSDADYVAAINAFNSITSHSLEGVAFADNFDPSKENNHESLFEFQASLSYGFEKLWLGNDWGIGAMHAYWGFFNCEWSFWDGTPFIPTQKIITAFETGDPRIVECFDSTNDQRFNGFMWTKYIKYMGSQTFTASMNNPRILRYADILLLKAEAVLQSGGDKAQAIGLINQVRERARGGSSLVPANLSTTETDPDIIMQWIMDERFRELSGEDDHRWFDLKRWHYAGYIDLGSWDEGDNGFSSIRSDFDFSGFFEDTQGKMWFPIPDEEIKYNRNIIQNPGY